MIWERRSASSVAGVYEAADDGTLTGVDGGCDMASDQGIDVLYEIFYCSSGIGRRKGIHARGVKLVKPGQVVL